MREGRRLRLAIQSHLVGPGKAGHEQQRCGLVDDERRLLKHTVCLGLRFLAISVLNVS